jgi:hypothetical protein
VPRGKPVVLSNGKSWPTQKAAEDHFRSVLHSYRNGDVIEDREHHEDLVALVERFDEVHVVQGLAPKAGCGIDYFFRKLNTSEGYSTPSFWIHRTDGTETDVSFKWAVKGEVRSGSLDFVDACRMAVQSDLLAAKRRFFDEHGDANGTVECEVSGRRITFEQAHVDHAWSTFGQLVVAFRAARGWAGSIPDGVVSAPADGQTRASFVDSTVADSFRSMHHGSAQLRIVDKAVNLSAASKARTVPRPT